MPRYDFRCHDCKIVFEESRSFAQANAPAVCPECAGENTYKLLSQVAVLSNGVQAQSASMPASSAGCGCGACSCGHH